MKKLLTILATTLILASCSDNKKQIYCYIQYHNDTLFIVDVYKSGNDTLKHYTAIEQYNEAFYIENYPSYYEEVLNMKILK